MLTRDLNLASQGHQTWEAEHKKYLCRVIRNIVEEVWRNYGTKDSQLITKNQLRLFLIDFSGVELTKEEFKRIYKQIDYDSKGRVDELKLGMFIIKVSSLEGVVDRDNMREALRETEHTGQGEFVLYPGQFSFL